MLVDERKITEKLHREAVLSVIKSFKPNLPISVITKSVSLADTFGPKFMNFYKRTGDASAASNDFATIDILKKRQLQETRRVKVLAARASKDLSPMKDLNAKMIQSVKESLRGVIQVKDSKVSPNQPKNAMSTKTPKLKVTSNKKVTRKPKNKLKKPKLN